MPARSAEASINSTGNGSWSKRFWTTAEKCPVRHWGDRWCAWAGQVQNGGVWENEIEQQTRGRADPVLAMPCGASGRLRPGGREAAGRLYPNSRWVCEDPHIEIVVDEKGRYTSTLIGDDGEEIRFSVPDMEWMPMQTEKLSLVMRHCCFGETVSYQKTDLQFKFARTIFGTALIPN